MKRFAIPLLATAALMMAQPSGMGHGPRGAMGAGAPGSVVELKAALGLSDAQVTSLQQIRTSQRETISTLARQMRTKNEALRASLSSGTTAVAAGTTLLEIEALRKQLTTVEGNVRTQALGVLTAEQRTKLKTLEDAAALQPAIRQATALGLLTHPVGPGGPRGMGGMGGVGPRGFRGGRAAGDPALR